VTTTAGTEQLDLQRGERVRLRSRTEILATLDESGAADGLPFMPEMLESEGSDLTVYKRADKTCDTIEKTGIRRMYDTVHLTGVRCDGSGHGGCQASCLIHWREAWLERIPEDVHAGPAASTPPQDGGGREPAELTLTAEDISGGLAEVAKTNAIRSSSNGITQYRCQATELREASVPMAWWDLRQYVRDVKNGNAPAPVVARGFLIGIFNKMQGLNRRFLPNHLLIHNGERYPWLAGSLTETPQETLDLEPGELVEIKSKEEIFATLDTTHRNRGMTFDVEMLKYCGRRARVRSRVHQIIDEVTGEMIRMRNPCIILEGVFCTSDYHHFCPRSTLAYWRETWLRRVDPSRRLTSDSSS
jgi:hypothetical protein